MTKDEFKPIVKRLKLAYSRDGFLVDKDQVGLWLTMLEDLDGEKVGRAADSYIRKSQFPPTIADLRAEYSRLKNRDSELAAQMFEIYGETKGVYPCSYDSPSTRVAWRNAVTALTQARAGLKPLDAAWTIRRVTANHVAEYERTGKVDSLPDWIDFLKGIENWATKQNLMS